ncbi:hypothetical protein EPO34_00805 [Patescibacteria group bacterium]|nr:MAG: hypothetical protein EPO34_00805 [Patescibacteria group bacterium]
MNRYVELKAKDNTELGHQLGEIFHDRLKAKLERVRGAEWNRKRKIALPHWAVTKRHFPAYADELVAYARAAGLGWQDLWTFNLEIGMDAERCTSMVTNRGKLIGHVEDFDPSSVDDLFLIRKTVGRTTVLDLNYFHTLGGNAASVNSHGWAQLVNTLHGPTRRAGIPRNVIARWLSESQDPERDARRLGRLPRMDGYAHTFVHADGRAFSLEVAAEAFSFSKASSPFVHANHYLSSLAAQETFRSASSTDRFEVATCKLKPRMTVDAIKKLMGDQSRGKGKSILNDDTIGKMVVDFKRHEAQAWFKAAPRKGYLAVPLNFLDKKTALS